MSVFLLSTDGIVKHMASKVGPASKELSSTAEYEKFLEKQEVAVIGFLKEGGSLKSVFEKVSVNYPPAPLG